MMRCGHDEQVERVRVREVAAAVSGGCTRSQ